MVVVVRASSLEKTCLLRLQPTHSTFKNIVISIVTHSKSFVVACVYHTPGSCFSAFLDDFLFFCGFLSSLTFSFIICGDFNVHVDTDCIDQRKFQNLLNTSNLAQNVKPIYPLAWSHTGSNAQCQRFLFCQLCDSW